MYTLALFLLAGSLLGSLNAATITWSVGSSFFGPTGHLTRSTAGSFVSGFNYGGPDLTIGGDLWTSSTFGFGAFNTEVAAGTADSTFNSMLTTAAFTESSFPPVFTLTGLTIGRSYLLQVFVADTRSCCSSRVQNFGGIQIVQGAGLVVEGTFVADAIQQNWSTNGSPATVLNGVQLRELPLPTNGGEVPEPTTFALLGGSLAVLLLRRR